MKYAIISDIHEDIVNLELALQKIEKSGCDEIICLGDISGFSVPHYQYFDTRNANRCMQLVKENCKIIIAGNHDLHAARLTPKINPEFEYPDNWYQMDYQERLHASEGSVWLYENDELSPMYSRANIDFIKTLPEIKVLETPMENILLTHFIYPNLTGSTRVFYSFIDDFEIHKDFMLKHNCSFSFSGHRHYAGLYIASSKIIEKSFNSVYQLKNNDAVLVPAIADKIGGSGFCIFDAEQNTIEAKRI